MSDKSLFKDIIAQGQQKRRNVDWYQNQVRKATVGLTLKQLEKTNEKGQKVKLVYPQPGKFYIFDYNPKYQEYLPVYDTFPLIFCYKHWDNGFIGMNLHYFNIKRRAEILKDIDNNRITLYPSRLYKYLDETKYTKGIIAEVPQSEIIDACKIPTEAFYSNVSGNKFKIPKNVVWRTTENIIQNAKKFNLTIT